MTTISRAEKLWVLKVGVAVMLLLSLPYLLAFTLQDPEMRFTGFIFAVEDGNSYLAKMLGGAQGAWLFRTPYTPMPQGGVLMFLPYLLLGRLASSPGMHEQQVALFHLFRFGSGLIFLLATYEFIAFFVPSITLRRFGVLLAGLGGGLGWLALLGGGNGALQALPLEFYSPETFGFLSLYGVPHLAAARAFLLWALLQYLKFLRSDEASFIRPALIAGLCWLLAGLFQPLNALVIGFVFSLHLAALGIMRFFARRRGKAAGWSSWRRALAFVLVAGLLPGLLVLYLALRLRQDAFLSAWSAQNILPSPQPLLYLLAFGLLLPFAWAGARRCLKQDRTSAVLLVGWALALPLLAYFPVNVQRRLPEGQWLVWGVLSLVAIEGWWSRPAFTAVYRRLLLLAPLCLSFVSTLLLLMGGFQTVLAHSSPVFRPSQEVELFEYLAETGPAGCLVVADFSTGNALPAWAPLRVVIGHGPESANLPTLRAQVAQFFDAGTDDAWRKAWLESLGACYVFWGPAEQALGAWDPRQTGFLDASTRSGQYWLLQVSLE